MKTTLNMKIDIFHEEEWDSVEFLSKFKKWFEETTKLRFKIRNMYEQEER